jgi:choline-sulfatase
MRRLSWIALPLLLVFACANREETAPGPKKGQPSVFLIVVDTLRSDRLSIYGHGSKQPAIESLARDSVVFRRAFSHAPQTLVAHASIFTGLLPPSHGVRDNIGYRLDRAQTLAQLLRSAGYSTGAAVSSYVLRRETGVAAGFDFYDDEMPEQAVQTRAERDGDRTRAALEQWLDSAGNDRRVFGFLHIYEPHAPHAAGDGFVDGYDGEVAKADAIVGRFLDSLKSRGMYENSLIILTSDHGEGLGEHGEDEHGVFVYRESIQIPLIVKLPMQAQRGIVREEMAGLADLLPTILDVTGVQTPSVMDGRSLAAALPRDRQIYAESYFPRLHFGWSELRALVGEEFHLIDAPAKELYRWSSDPAELRNVATTERRTLFAMQKSLDGIEARFQKPGWVDPEDQRKLAALGYIGSGGESKDSPVDPKDRVDTIRKLREAFILFGRGETETVISRLRGFVQTDPDVADGWLLLGQSLMRRGDSGAAAEALKEGLRRFPRHTAIALATSDALIAAGRLDEARSHAELALSDDETGARERLARIEMASKRWNAAEAHLRDVLGRHPNHGAALVLLAEVMRESGRKREQLQTLDRVVHLVAEKKIDPLPGIQFQRGELLLAARQVPLAEQAFRAEVDAFPSNRQAWSSLALVAGAQGRREEARKLMLEAVKQNRDARMVGLAIESLQVLGDEEGVRMVRTMGESLNR